MVDKRIDGLLMPCAVIGPVVACMWFAAGPAVGFEWDAPTGCPEAEAVRAQVEARIDRPVDKGQRSNLEVIARVRKTDDGRWDMRLWFITPEGTRHRDVTDESCELLAETAATLVALRVQEDEAERERASAIPPAAPASTQAKPLPVVRAAPAGRPQRGRSRRPLAFDLRAHGAVGFGLLPRIDAGPVIAINLDAGSLRVELVSAVLFAPPVAVARGGEARFVAASAALRAGWIKSLSRVQVAITGGPELGAVTARGRGLASDGKGTTFWGAVTLGPAVTVRPVLRLGIWAAVDGFVAFARPRFRVDEIGLVHRSGPAGVRALVGVSVRMGKPEMESGGRRQRRSAS